MKYDDAVEYDEAVEIELENPRPIAIKHPLAFKSLQKLELVGRALSRVSWRTYIVGGSFLAALCIYTTQWQKPEQPVVQENRYDIRNIPAYAEGPLMQQELKEVSEHDLNLAALINDERQREVISLAQAYIGLATANTQTPGHQCQGKTVLDCLLMYYQNRITDLNNLAIAPPPKSTRLTPANLLGPILRKAEAREKTEALIVAEIMMTPAAARRPTQQQIIDTVYPSLNSGVPINQLKPRPATLAKELTYGEQLQNNLRAKSPEEQNTVELCMNRQNQGGQVPQGCN